MLTMGDSNASDANAATTIAIAQFPIKSRKNKISLKYNEVFNEDNTVTSTSG